MNKKNNIKSIYSNFALLTTAFIWGVSFVAQKSGMAFVGPFTFNAARTFLGGLSLLPVIGVLKMISMKHDTRTSQEKAAQHKILAKGGMLCGFLLFSALTINLYGLCSGRKSRVYYFFVRYFCSAYCCFYEEEAPV